MSENSHRKADRTGKADAAPLLALHDVYKTYADGQVQALAGVSFAIERGQFVSVMGKSGCGKSTLLNMLGALDRPTSGEVYFEGTPLNAIENLDQLRALKIGFVFQSFYLLPNLTAIENVQLPMFESPLAVKERPRRAQALLEMVGLADRQHHLPNQLSIGQRQRVAIARSLANQPSIVLADEPTGSLDSQSGQEIMELLAKLHQDQDATLVVVTHDEQVANYGQRLICMLDGSILQDTPIKTC